MDPVSIIGLATTVGQVIMGIYDVCEAFVDAPRELNDLCDELVNIQEVLGKISAIMQFQAGTTQADKYKDKKFQGVLDSTKDLLYDLLGSLKKPSRGWFGSTRQRISWMWRKKDIEDYRHKIEARQRYFSLALSASNLESSHGLYLEVLKLGDSDQRQRTNTLRRWLGDYDYNTVHSHLVALHESRTGDWFVDNGHLTNWLQRDKSGPSAPTRFLWLRGKSGSGKSCLSAYAIERMVERWDGFSDRAVVFFHCSFQDNSSQSSTALLASLISQLCDRNPDLWRVVSKIHDDIQRSKSLSTKPDYPVLSDLFHHLADAFERVLIFLDAPNEVPTPADLIDTLAVAAQKHRSMDVCVSSTPDLEMKSTLAGRHSYLTVNMDSPGQKKDMEHYVSLRIEKNISLRSVDKELKESITSTLLGKSDGSFRYIECHLTTLATKDCASQIKAALETLPPSLNKHYGDLLRVVPRDDIIHTRIRRLLRWVTVQTRPLTIKELEEAVVVDWSQGNVLNKDDRLLPGKIHELLRLCGSLIHYDSEAQTVSLGHQSVKDFLTSPDTQRDSALSNIIPGDEQCMINNSLGNCLGYLTQPQFRAGYVQSASGQTSRKREWPLLEYCAKSLMFYWEETVKVGFMDLNYFVPNLELFCRPGDASQNGGSWGTFLQQVDPQYIPSPTSSSATPGTRLLTPMGYAASQGWKFMINFMIDRNIKEDLDTPSSSSALPPLIRAICYGHEVTAQLLLNAGARVTDQLHGTAPGHWWRNCSPAFKEIMAEALEKQKTGATGAVHSATIPATHSPSPPRQTPARAIVPGQPPAQASAVNPFLYQVT